MKDCINNLTHSLLQQGDEIRQRSYGAPPLPTKDLTTTSSGDSRATRADARNQPFMSPTASYGSGAIHDDTPQTPGSTLTPMDMYNKEVRFNRRKRDYVSRLHQPMPMLVSGN
jgi:hypothetical protein